jgi:lysophospholipase L1-like esterase
VLAAAGALATAVMIAGFVYGTDTVLNPGNAGSSPLNNGSTAAGERTIESDGQTRLVALGDSLTAGVGAPAGEGYADALKRALDVRSGGETILTQLAVGGYRTEDVLRQLDSSEVQGYIRDADYIVMTIGGNDLFTPGGEVNLETIQPLFEPAAAGIRTIFERLVELNPDAEIYYSGLFNPFLSLENGADISRAAERFNHLIFNITTEIPQVTFVPTFDLFLKEGLDGRSYLSADRYHPSQEGYARMADRIAAVME